MEEDRNVADVEVIDAARRGDPSAVQELWRTYQPQLLRFLGARGASDPEDIASQVWIDVGRTLGHFVGDGVAFQRWIFTIARNRSVDETRRRSRRREVLDDQRFELEAASTEPDAVERSGSLEWAIGTVRKLPTSMAEAVMLRVVLDLPIADVAAMTGQSEGNVRVLVHRGLKQLGTMLSSSEMAVQ